MSKSPQDVYAKCLPIHYGYPLWNPEPSNTLPHDHKQDGLQVGDVGFVDPDRGFDVLFNICKPHDHPLHQPHGVPPSLRHSESPIRLGGDEVFVRRDIISPGSVISSNGVQEKHHPSNDSPNSDYEFTVWSSEGAILILPHGATFHDLKVKTKFRDFAKQCAVDWYRFVMNDLGREISNDSLYLITGFYKARSWMLASFQDAPPDCGWSIKATRAGNDSESTHYQWKYDFHTACKHWPLPGITGNVNQSIFLRGYKIALKDRLFGALHPTADAISLHNLPVGASCLPFLDWALHRRRRRNLSKLIHHPALSQPFHYSDVINCYLLGQNPDASVAITHDSDWADLLETGEMKPHDLIQEGYLVRFLSERYCSGSHDGVVYLQVKSEIGSQPRVSHYSDDLGDNHPGPECMVAMMSEPSCDESRTLITYIRHDQSIIGLERMYSECHASADVSGDSEGRPSGKPTAAGAAATESSEPILQNNTRVVITRMRGDQLISGPEQAPTECYVVVGFSNVEQRTKNKSVTAGEAVEWDDQILLPAESSAMLRFSIHVTSELDSFGGKEETSYMIELAVERLLDEELIIFPSQEGNTDESDCPSLLITMECKELENLDDSVSISHSSTSHSNVPLVLLGYLATCLRLARLPFYTDHRSREELFLLAKASEGDECWEDVINYMKKIALLGQGFTPEEREVFSAGYKSLVAACRTTWGTISSAERKEDPKDDAARLASIARDREKIEDKIVDTCREVLGIIELHLIPSITSTECIVFYGQMVGDYHRHSSDFELDARRKRSIQSSMEAYEDSWSLATSGLEAIHPLRLRAALNLSLFYHEVLHSLDQALQVAEKALDDVSFGLDELSKNGDSMLIIERLRENVIYWKLNCKEKQNNRGDGEDADQDEIHNDPGVPNGDLAQQRQSNQVNHNGQPLHPHQHSLSVQESPKKALLDLDAKAGGNQDVHPVDVNRSSSISQEQCPEQVDQPHSNGQGRKTVTFDERCDVIEYDKDEDDDESCYSGDGEHPPEDWLSTTPTGLDLLLATMERAFQGCHVGGTEAGVNATSLTQPTSLLEEVDGGDAWKVVRRRSELNNYAKQIKEYQTQKKPNLGKVFVNVLGIKDLKVPVPQEATAISCTLNNGIHFVTTPEAQLSPNARVDQEFELIEHSELEFTLTFKVRRDPHIVAQFRVLKPKTGLAHLSEEQAPLAQKALAQKVVSRPKRPVARAPPTPPLPELPDNLARYLQPDCTLARAFISFKDIAPRCDARPLDINYPLIGQRSEASGDATTVELGEVILRLFRLPPLPDLPSPQLPKSMDECLRGLRYVAWHKVSYFQGTLTQNGGDCTTWRTRMFRLTGASLIAHNIVTKKAAAVINLRKAISVEDVRSSEGRYKDERDPLTATEHCFRLVFPPEQEILFFAYSKEEKVKWVELLRAMIGRIPSYPLWGELVWQHQQEVDAQQQSSDSAS